MLISVQVVSVFSSDLRDRMGKFIKEMVENPESKWGRYFDAGILIAIVVSLMVFSIETLPGISRDTLEVLETADAILVAVFLMEYVVRVWCAEKKAKYIFSFYGLVDLVAILPYFLAGVLGGQTVRVIRLLRIFRILKLARYTSALGRIGKALSSSKEELLLFLAVSMAILYVSALGIYYFEHAAQPDKFRSIFDCLWWAVATLTTVGYGDVYPITVGGRLFTFIILLLGLGVVAVPAGIISAALSELRREV